MKKKYLLLFLLVGLFVLPFKVNADIPVKQILVRNKDYYVDTGTSFYLTADVYPKNATNQSVTWSSSDSSIASISPTTGGVTTKEQGIVTFTATANDGSGISESIVLKVGYNNVKVGEKKYIKGSVSTTYDQVKWTSYTPEIVRLTNNYGASGIFGVYTHFAEVEGVFNGTAYFTVSTISDELLSVEPVDCYSPIESFFGSQENLVIATNSSDNAGIYTYPSLITYGLEKNYYVSEDESIATVDQEGNVTGLKNGETTVRVYSQYNNIEKEIPVFVYTNAEEIVVDTEEVSLDDENRTYQLTYEVLPKEATWRAVSFTSNDESIVTVNNLGLITAIDNGDTTITLSAQNNLSKTINVHVSGLKTDINTLVTTNPQNVTYTGKSFTPDIFLYDSNKDYQLIKDKDYTLSYSKNKNAGTATITAEGIGNYKGTRNFSFTIYKANIEYQSNGTTVTYDGENHTISLEVTTPKVTIKYADENNEYTLDSIPTYKDAGVYTIKYKLTKKNYNDVEQEETLVINKANIEYQSNGIVVPYDGENHTISLEVTTPNVTIKYADENNEYTLDSIPSYKEVGVYTIKFKLTGDNYNEEEEEETLEITKVDILSLEANPESIDYGEVNQDFDTMIIKKVIIKNTGNVAVKLDIKNPTGSGPFGSLAFDTGHILNPDEEYEAELVLNPNGTYHNTPGTYNGIYQIKATSLEKNDTYTLEIPAQVVIKKLPMKISYTTHVQDYGWQNYVSDGVMAGTQGESKRLEGIKIRLDNQDYVGNIEYKTHIQDYGWEKNYSKNNEMSGTSGQSKRLEAIQIKLTGKMAEYYDVYYRVHAQNFGWLGWARNDEESGTAGYAYRLEGIEIVLVEKGTPFEEYGKDIAFKDKEENTPPTTPGNKPNVDVEDDDQMVEYTTHVQNIGWQDYTTAGLMAGTSGQALRLEGIKIRLKDQKYSGNIEYRTHIQNIGWETKFKKNDEMSGTSGKSLRLEAIEIKLTGEMAEHYDIYYTVHAENFGWLGWAKNGERAGTAGYAYRLEGIIIKLVPKGQEFPLKTKKPKAFYDKNEL